MTVVAWDVGEAGGGLHGCKEGRVKVAVFDHEADRTFLDLGAVEGEGQGRGAFARPPVAGDDLQHRLAVGF